MTPADPPQLVSKLRSQIVDTGAVVVVGQSSTIGTVLDPVRETTVRTVVVPQEGTSSSDLCGAVVAFEGFLVGDEELSEITVPATSTLCGNVVAHLAYAGGTTGVPKGVRVLHRNIIANVTQMIAQRAGSLPVLEDCGLLILEPIPDLDDSGVSPGHGSSVVVSPLFHAHALINMQSGDVACPRSASRHPGARPRVGPSGLVRGGTDRPTHPGSASRNVPAGADRGGLRPHRGDVRCDDCTRTHCGRIQDRQRRHASLRHAGRGVWDRRRIPFRAGETRRNLEGHADLQGLQRVSARDRGSPGAPPHRGSGGCRRS